MAKIDSVFEAKSTTIRRAMDQKGGWDFSLQVELADQLENSGVRLRYENTPKGKREATAFTEYTTERGVHVFLEDPKKKIDLCLTPHKQFRARWPYVGIELKTYSMGQEENSSHLRDRVMDDVDKCASAVGTKATRSKKSKILLLCIGVIALPEDLTALQLPETATKLGSKSFKKLESRKVLNEGGILDPRPFRFVWTWTSQKEDVKASISEKKAKIKQNEAVEKKKKTPTVRAKQEGNATDEGAGPSGKYEEGESEDRTPVRTCIFAQFLFNELSTYGYESWIQLKITCEARSSMK